MKYCFIVVLGLLASSAMAQQGEWEPRFDFGDATHQPIPAVHLIHLHTGKVLAFTFDPHDCTDPNAGGRYYLWTPPPPNSPGNPGQFQSMPNCHNWALCTGHSAMADGRILVAGSEWAYFWGNTPYADLFDPNYMSAGFAAWNYPQPPPDMDMPRWYPTVTTLPDGKVLVCAGTFGQGPNTINITVPELYDPETSTWTRLFSAERTQARYPYMFVLPDGNMVDAGPELLARILVTSTWEWAAYVPVPTWPDPPPPHPSYDGSAVMYEPGKIMRCGGSTPGPVVATTWV